MMNWLKYEEKDNKKVLFLDRTRKIHFELPLGDSDLSWAGPGNLRNQKAR